MVSTRLGHVGQSVFVTPRDCLRHGQIPSGFQTNYGWRTRANHRTFLPNRLTFNSSQTLLEKQGDHNSESDYDCLIILEEVSNDLKDRLDEIAREMLYEYNAVFSAFPICRETLSNIPLQSSLNECAKRGNFSMNASDDKKIQIQQMVLKSQRSLKAARQHLQDKDFDFTASRAYYAVFYLMETVLLVKDLSGSTHSGIIRLFSEHFIKTNVFPRAPFSRTFPASRISATLTKNTALICRSFRARSLKNASVTSKTSQAEAKLVTEIGPSPWKSNGEALSNCRHALLVMRSLTTRSTSQSST